jgi:BolA protein
MLTPHHVRLVKSSASSSPYLIDLFMSNTIDRIALIRSRLAVLEPTELNIRDDSHLHAGHAGAEGGAGHYHVHIVTTRFEGLTRVARHRLVYDLLQDLIPHPIHALAMDTQVPLANNS